MLCTVNSICTNTKVPTSLTKQQQIVWKARWTKRCGCISERDIRQKMRKSGNTLKETKERKTLSMLTAWYGQTVLRKKNESDDIDQNNNHTIEHNDIITSTDTRSKKIKKAIYEAWCSDHKTKNKRKKALRSHTESVLRPISKNLYFMCWKVLLPSRAEIHGQKSEVDALQKQQNLEAIESMFSNKKSRANQVLINFQNKIRAELKQRQSVRLIEYDSWLHNCKKERFILSVITSSFVGILGGFTMIICVLLSATFSDTQCILWVGAVAQSIAMQVFVCLCACFLLLNY